MYSSYLRTFFKGVTRDKGFALINIVGLSVAVACCIVIGLYLKFQLGYDRHFANHDNLYRVIHTSVTNGTPIYSANTSAALAPTLKQDFPEVENAVRIRPLDAQAYFRSGDDVFPWQQVFYADDTIFAVFSHEILAGDPATALIEPNTIAISESMARAYFGEQNALGKVLSLGTTDYRISLVFRDLPANTHLKYDALISFNGRPDATNTNLEINSFFRVTTYTYVVMPKGYNRDSFAGISQVVYDRYMQEFGNARSTKVTYVLEPLAEIHNFSPEAQGDQPHGNGFNIFAYTAVAAFVLLVACINYVNLATVRSTRQMKAIGMRKILGASKYALMAHYLLESLVFMFVAVLFGFVLAEVATMIFPLSQYLDMGSEGFAGLTLNFQLVSTLLLLCLPVALTAGAYPALYLAGFAPLLAFSSASRSGKRAITLRSILVVIQFTMTVVVVASTLLIFSQLQYLTGKPLGFDKDNKLVIDVQSAELIERLSPFMEQLRQIAGVNEVFSTSSLPGTGIYLNLINVENNDGVMQPEKFNQMYGDFNIVEGLGARLLQGRSFDEAREADLTSSVIVNEAAVRQMGWDDPIGKRYDNNLGLNAHVIGVVQDFNFSDLRSGIAPLAITWTRPDYSNMNNTQRMLQTRKLVIDIEAGNQQQTIDDIAESWTGFTTAYPFEFRYLSDILNEHYSNEENLRGLLMIFSLICIFISCLGLFGLSTFITQLRTREVGIRKVLGAKVSQIIYLLGASIVPAVLVSTLVGSAISFLLVRRWLESFYYVQAINPLAFVASSLLVLVVAMGTIALQSNRTARMKPSVTLKVE